MFMEQKCLRSPGVKQKTNSSNGSRLAHGQDWGVCHTLREEDESDVKEYAKHDHVHHHTPHHDPDLVLHASRRAQAQVSLSLSLYLSLCLGESQIALTNIEATNAVQDPPLC